MNTKIRSMLLVMSLVLMTGCVAYAPYPQYSAGPYNGYGYAAPIAPVPVPLFYGGWGRGGYGHYGGHHWHH